ncbi:heme-dependent oxidative N-demethylase family protein [Pseudooceanicola sp. MF1-13]|uniref:heme-dependent oxidative N-demethylase family protein n=1 Tax=Pseudooceanicola sp. MF1-13 TaxID=3379095 RepID=UPI003891277E
MSLILHDRIPYDTGEKSLPGIAPLDPADWVIRDEVFAQQMALRDQLITTRRDEVIALTDAGRAAAEELLQAVLDDLAGDEGYLIDADIVQRPDGVRVTLDRNDPLGALGRLVQQDFCLLQKPDGGDEHVLTGAVLCFPAGWMLAQKIDRPLIRIHVPVPSYDDDIARRVQRLFDGVQVGRPLWRYNALGYVDPALFQPRAEGVPKYGDEGQQRFIRSERQTILRLPQTRAVVFGIHTFVVRKPLS